MNRPPQQANRPRPPAYRPPPPPYQEPRRYYNARDFRRGQRLPPEFWGGQYVVDDWRLHRLPPPPVGYHWVQVGPDYVLAAIATGLIANLILNQ